MSLCCCDNCWICNSYSVGGRATGVMIAITVDPSWNQDAAICVRQDLPLPLTVLSMTLEIQSGG